MYEFMLDRKTIIKIAEFNMPNVEYNSSITQQNKSDDDIDILTTMLQIQVVTSLLRSHLGLGEIDVYTTATALVRLIPIVSILCK